MVRSTTRCFGCRSNDHFRGTHKTTPAGDSMLSGLIIDEVGEPLIAAQGT